MFNLQGSEIIIVMLLALVVLGPEKLPDAMRKMGQMFAELKKLSSGFQSEFRSAIDEPMRELRDTANVLRDSADFTKLQDGERQEKPKSAEMAPVDPDDVPVDDIPTFESPGDDAAEPDLATDSRPAPFADDPPAPERPTPTPVPAPPLPFTAMSASESADTERAVPEPDGAAAVDAVADDAARDVPDEPSPSAGRPTPSGAEDATGETDAEPDADDEPDLGR